MLGEMLVSSAFYTCDSRSISCHYRLHWREPNRPFHYSSYAILSLICSAAITVVAAWDGFLRSRDLWVQKTDTWMSLQNLEARINYAKAKVGEMLPQEQVDEFYKHFDQILMGEHELWKKIRSTKTTPPPTKARTRI